MQNVQVVDGMFHDVTLSVNNYDALLNGWSNETVNSGFYGAVFDGGNSQYSVNGLSGRYLLANTYEWNILTADIIILRKTFLHQVRII